MLNVQHVNRLRQRLRDFGFEPFQVKSAELGGGQDVPFEQAFSSLAHSYVKDKAPKLLDWEVGFQLVEKNGENTKAVGVFGFKVGSQWLYAPVFFLNGDLKGHELLYLKSQDTFVPMKENWVNYILGKRPSLLGEGVPRNLGPLGVMAPNLSQITRSPSKFASARPAIASWLAPFLPDLGRLVTTPLEKAAKYRGLRGLPEFLGEIGPAGFRDLLTKLASYPGFVAAVDHFYGVNFLTGLTAAHRRTLEKAARAGKSLLAEKAAAHPGCGSRGKKGPGKSSILGVVKKADDPRERVRVYREKDVVANPDLIHELDGEDRKALLKARVVVKDRRSDGEISHAYNVQTPFRAFNPDDTGLWEVLQKPDEFKRVLVIKGPYAVNGRQEYATVVTADGRGKPWCNVHPGHLWARARYDDEAFRDWLGGQKDASEVKESPTQIYVLIGPSGEGTVPFQVGGSFQTEGETKIFDVKFLAGCTYTFPGQLPDHSYRGKRDPYNVFPNGERLILTGRPGARIVVRDGELYVPAGFKMVTIEPLDDDVKKQLDEQQSKKPEEGSLRKSKDQMPPPKILDSKDGKPTERTKDQQELLARPHEGPTPMFLPGTITDLQLALLTHTLPLKVFSDGKDVTVNDRRLDKEGAWVHLVVDHHFREKAARHIVGEAVRKGGLEVRVKYAADPADDMIRGAPGAPAIPEPPRGADSIMGSGVPSQEMQEEEIKVPGMSAGLTDRSVYLPFGPDSKSMAVAQQAAQTGQREVFDTAALGSLLGAVREDSIVDRYMGDLMKGLDRLGRILFQFYWHQEEFEDRYGKQDMPEIEDALRNAFEGVGDIVLALKRKTVDPYQDESTDVDLGALANQ